MNHINIPKELQIRLLNREIMQLTTQSKKCRAARRFPNRRFVSIVHSKMGRVNKLQRKIDVEDAMKRFEEG